MELKIQLKPMLTQKLVMTPQLQQAIKMLQLSRIELLGKIQQELEENPALEKIEDREPDQSFDDAIDFYSYLEPSGAHHRSSIENDGKQTAGFETYTPAEETLADHLLWQLMASSPSQQEKRIGSLIVGSLDERGYLKASVEEIASIAGAEVQAVQDDLSLMQTFDPPGICARDLKECLLIQAGTLDPQDSIVSVIVAKHLNDLEQNNFKAICQALKVDIKAVASAVNIIKGFEPLPARQFSEHKALYIEPDIFVYKMKNDFIIQINNSGMPKLSIGAAYKRILKNARGGSDETKNYLKQRLQSARWIITSIQQREQTIYRVMQSILNFQIKSIYKWMFLMLLI